MMFADLHLFTVILGCVKVPLRQIETLNLPSITWKLFVATVSATKRAHWKTDIALV